MKKRYTYAMTIRMTDEVMAMITRRSEELGLSKNQIVQIILKQVADSYVQSKKVTDPCRVICEFQNQIEYTSESSFKNIVNNLYKRGIILDYAYIVHDKDTYTEQDELDDIKNKAGNLKKLIYMAC